jgi:hypothetical protein
MIISTKKFLTLNLKRIRRVAIREPTAATIIVLIPERNINIAHKRYTTNPKKVKGILFLSKPLKSINIPNKFNT